MQITAVKPAFLARHTARYTVHRSENHMGYLMGYQMSPPPQLLRSRRPAIVAEAQPLRRAVTSQEIKLPPIKQQLRSSSHEDIFHKCSCSYGDSCIFSNDLSAAAAADKELLSMCHRGVFLL